MTSTLSSQVRIPTVRWYLENREDGHSKFYTCYVTDTGVLALAWGRIGTAGQCKVEQYPAFVDARTIALRQVYAKAAKGYRIVEDEFKFTVGQAGLELAAEHQTVVHLNKIAEEAIRENKFAGEQQSATQHYDSFIAQAERLMQRAATEPVADVLADYSQLEAAWRELDDKHGIAETTLSLTGSMLRNALAGDSRAAR
jgi:predicted DNA-binding WGR domain protein